MKVLYVHNSLDLGGAQSVRYMFLKHLDSKSLQINICCLGQKGEFGKKIENLGYRVDAFNQPFDLSHFSTTRKLFHYIKSNNFDIVHSALFYANYHAALAASWAKIPFLVTEEHGEHYLHSKRRHFIYRAVARKISKRSSLVFCCSDYVKRGIQQTYGLKDKNTVVLKNLTEDKRLDITRSKGEMRTELNIPFDAIVMGTLSSLYWVKNQRILIEALAQLNKNDLFLIITGDGPIKNDLKEYAQKLGVYSRVRFTGWRNDVADMLNAFDIFVLPSVSEGLPICLLEAMSLALPCIASRVGGIEEVIKDGETGLFVAPKNLNDLISTLKRLINDRKFGLELGLAARKYVLDNFRPSVYVGKVLDSYRMVLTKRRNADN